MDPLYREGTENTPSITLDAGRGVFEIAGRSLPDNAGEIYAPVVTWFSAYAALPNPDTDLVLRLEYINTASSKLILDVFFALQKIKGAHVSWYFLEDDEDMEETGEEFAELAGVPFELKAY